MTKPRMTKPRIRLKGDGNYVYVYDDRRAQEEWERCNPPRGKPAEDNR